MVYNPMSLKMMLITYLQTQKSSKIHDKMEKNVIKPCVNIVIN